MWDDERTADLKKYYAEGCSASVIAGRLGGTTRNAVIGKIHRLGLAGRDTVRRIKNKVNTNRLRPALRPSINLGNSRRTTGHYKPVFPTAPEPLPAPVADDIASISYAAFVDPKAEIDIPRNACRWPVGDPTAGFCGCSNVPGLPYCAVHAARATRPYAVAPRAFSTPQLGIGALRAVEEFTA